MLTTLEHGTGENLTVFPVMVAQLFGFRINSPPLIPFEVRAVFCTDTHTNLVYRKSYLRL